MSEQLKSTTPAQEQSYPPPALVPYPHQAYNSTSFPPGPGGYGTPIFAYPPPPDGTHTEGQSGPVSGPPYVIPLPPGLVYAYPPHAQPAGFNSPPANTPSSSSIRPKRKQVKMACTNCANACKRCDDNRPCERCVKYGTADACMDGTRKERKKGVKRGPYKRKNKEEGEDNFDSQEWPSGQPPPPAPATPAPPTTPYVPAEGYYQVYYPPGAFISHPPDGQPTPDGAPPPNGQHVIPYFVPGPYPPFHYPQMYSHPPPGAVPHTNHTSSQPTPAPSQSSVPQQTQVDTPPTTVNPADTSRKPDSIPASVDNAVVDPALAAPVTGSTSRKRKRTTKSGEKTKKAKNKARDVEPTETLSGDGGV